MTAKFTGVGRLLGRDHGNKPVSLPIPKEKFDDPTFIARLSFRQTPRVPTDVQDQLEHLPMHSDHALFIDTNLTWLDEEWWETLLAEPGAYT